MPSPPAACDARLRSNILGVVHSSAFMHHRITRPRFEALVRGGAPPVTGMPEGSWFSFHRIVLMEEPTHDINDRIAQLEQENGLLRAKLQASAGFQASPPPFRSSPATEPCGSSGPRQGRRPRASLIDCVQRDHEPRPPRSSSYKGLAAAFLRSGWAGMLVVILGGPVEVPQVSHQPRKS